LKKYISNSEIQNIIKQSFQDFFNSIVSRIDTQNNKTISFIGSVAYNFSTQLQSFQDFFNSIVSPERRL